MRRVLIVVSQALDDEQLCRKATEYMAEGRCQFFVLVPAIRCSTRHRFVWTEGESRALARSRLNSALARLRAAGAEAEGRVGDERPMTAMRDLLCDARFDEIVLATNSSVISRLFGCDLHRRVTRVFPLPVTGVRARPNTAVRLTGTELESHALSTAAAH